VPQGGRIDLYCERNQERLRLTDGIATDMIIGMPGTCTNAITVASYNSKVEWQSIDGGSYRFIEGFALHDLSPFSSWGPRRDGALKPDLAAPGAAVVSVRADGYDPAVMSIDPSGVHAVMWGTSMAAPHVSGAIALMLQKDPSLTPAQIKSILLETARADQFTGAVPNTRWGAGKLDVKAAVDAVGGGESCQTVPGDANADAAVNILDLVAAVNDILGTVPLAGGERACADVNQDAAIDVLDVVGIVNIILGKRAPEDLAARRTAELAARRDTRPAGPDIPATRGEGAAASTSAGPAAPVAWGRALDERGFRFRLDGREAAGLQMSFILPRGYRLAGAPEVAGAVPGVRVDHAERVGQHAVLLYNPAGGALAAGTAPVELLLPAVPDWDGGETIADLRVTRLTLAGVDGGELRLQEAPALGDGGGGSLPASLALQASPNPAAGCARIAYELGASGAVRIGVFDAAGRQVRVLWNGWQMAGAHVLPWDGRNDDGAAVGPGVYFVRVDTGREADSRKLIVLR